MIYFTDGKVILRLPQKIFLFVPIRYLTERLSIRPMVFTFFFASKGNKDIPFSHLPEALMVFILKLTLNQ